MTSPLEFLMEELTSDNPQQCIQCISRLRVIGLALGQEKTRSDLLPFLKGEIEAGKFTDEVQVSIAEVLGSFSEFVGPSSEAHCLFPPLEALCSVEESTVRDQAVASINQVGAQLSAAQLQTHLAPIVLRLARNKDWFTPRVSACGLVALAYSACAGTPVAAELREEFKALCVDDSPMVRRAAAARLGAVAVAYGKPLVENELLQLYRGLLVDEQESVRVNALKQTALVCKNVDLLTRPALLKDCFTVCTRDKAWRVRIASAESLAEVAEGCKEDGQPLSAEARLPLEQMYAALQSDHEADVRIAAALRGAEVATALGAAFGKAYVFPVVSQLAMDVNSVSRVELSTVVMELAAPLGKAGALDLVLSCLTVLADDELTNVRLAVLLQLGPFIRVTGLNGEAQEGVLLPLLVRLGDDKNWRIRHVILHLMPQLSAELGPNAFWKHFSSIVEKRASDACALVREDWVSALLTSASGPSPALRQGLPRPFITHLSCHPSQVKVMAQIASTPGYGQPWAEETLLAPVLALVDEKSYLMRAVVLQFTVGLAGMLSATILETKLLPAALEMAGDRVPNLRIMAVRALCAVTPFVAAAMTREKILPKLHELLSDADVDVKFEADAALESDNLKAFS